MMVYRPILRGQSECFQDITTSQEIHITYSGNAEGGFKAEPTADSAVYKSVQTKMSQNQILLRLLSPVPARFS